MRHPRDFTSHTSRRELVLLCVKAFLLHISTFFPLPAAGRTTSSRLRGTKGARPNTTAQVWALTEVRGTCSWGSKSHVTTGRHSEHVETSRPMQTRVQVKKMSDDTCDVLDLECRNCRYKLLSDGKLFPPQQLARHVTTFSTKRYNFHDLGRIVSSHARSCSGDMTTRWWGLHL